MNTIARLAGLTGVLILLLLAGSALGQQWLKVQTERLRLETLAAKRVQFEQLLAISHTAPPPWDDAQRKSLAQALGAQSIAEVKSAGQAEDVGASWTFNYTFPRAEIGGDAPTIHVQLLAPHSAKLALLYQRATVVLFLLGLTLLVLLGAVAMLAVRRTRENREASQDAESHDGAGMSSLARLARVSVEQGAELEHERNERVRIQEDLNFQQVLLNRALEQKIRLGHDLHDGIIQALYATGLTLEAAKASAETNPALARQQVETALQTLNTTIRDVRTYILGLTPDTLKEQSFADSVRSITETLAAGRPVKFDLQVDSEATSHLTEDQSTDLLQIVREAVSNGIRHGGAQEIVIRLQESGGEICLVVQDNGKGFDLTRAVRGHGLANIQSRAERLTASVRCITSPGGGTRTVVTLPAIAPAAR